MLLLVLAGKGEHAEAEVEGRNIGEQIVSARLDVLPDVLPPDSPTVATKRPASTPATELGNSRSQPVAPRYRVLEERSPREYRHWSPQSQPYAPGDVLLHLLNDGWSLHPQVFVQSYRCTSGRHVQVYMFVLLRNQERQLLRVVENPAVRRLVQTRRLTVEPVEECFVCAKAPSR